jgi:hypothetical protein
MPYTIPPLLHTIRREADMIAPARSKASDGTKGDDAHSKRKSDHNPDGRGIVHAIDLTHDPKKGFDARAEGEALRQRVKAGLERRVKYLVSYDDRGRHDIIASSVQGWAWRKKRGRDHASHLHISIDTGPGVENSTRQMLRPLSGGLTKPDPVSPPPATISGGCAVPEGYYAVSNTGAVYAYGPPFWGGWNGMPRNADICAIAARVMDGKTVGYWLAAYDGGVLSFGNAPFHGGLGGMKINGFVIDIRATSSGGGYWLFGTDGGVFSFGDAPFLGAPTSVVV